MRGHPALLVIALVLGAGGCVAPAALAGGSSHDSSVMVQGVLIDEPNYTVYGKVTSPTKKCLANRKVKVYLQAGSGDSFKQVDTARSSANGTWAGSGTTNTAPRAAKAVLVKSKFGPKRHRQSCSADHEVYILDK
jgi:hypothetical protein